MQYLEKYKWLALILGGYFFLGITFSSVVPIFEGPDEPAYFEHTRFLIENRTLPSEASPDRPGHVQTAGHPPLYPFLGALLIHWVDSSGYLGWKRNPFYSNGPDSLGQNVFLHSPEEDFPYRGVSLAVHLLRYLSILLGAGTVVATWVMARIVAPAEDWLAIGATAFVAFLPQFVFMSSLVNSDNLVNFLCAVAMVQILRIGLGRTQSRWAFLALGALVGLANIAKGSAIVLIPLSALGIALGARRMGRTELWKGIGLATVTFLLMAGWWYGRNFLLYGDALALGWRKIAFPDAMRQAPLTVAQVQEFLVQVGASFWARFGWGTINLDSQAYVVAALVFMAAMLGLGMRLVRERGETNFPARGLMLLGANVALVGAQLFLLWSQFPLAADQGRYLFTALPAIAILFVYGLGAFLSARGRNVAAPAGAVGLFAATALIPFLVLVPAHTPFVPPPAIAASEIPENAKPSNIVFGDAIGVAAYAAPRRVTPNSDVIVRVFWAARRPIETDNNVGLSLVAEDGKVLWERARRPGRGRSPTSLWKTGEVIPDIFTVRVPPHARHGKARFMLRVSERGGGDWLTNKGETAAILSAVKIQ